MLRPEINLHIIHRGEKKKKKKKNSQTKARGSNQKQGKAIREGADDQCPKATRAQRLLFKLDHVQLMPILSCIEKKSLLRRNSTVLLLYSNKVHAC